METQPSSFWESFLVCFGFCLFVCLAGLVSRGGGGGGGWFGLFGLVVACFWFLFCYLVFFPPVVVSSSFLLALK